MFLSIVPTRSLIDSHVPDFTLANADVRVSPDGIEVMHLDTIMSRASAIASECYLERDTSFDSGCTFAHDYYGARYLSIVASRALFHAR